MKLSISSLPGPESPQETRRATRAFTLVELMVVVVILAILASVAIPRLVNNTQEATENLLMANVTALQARIDYQKFRDPDEAWPATIDPSWFARQALPEHPQNTFGVRKIETASDILLDHPTFKTLTAESAGAYWYNPRLGVLRARVAAQDSDEETLAFYNRVNQSDATWLGVEGDH